MHGVAKSGEPGATYGDIQDEEEREEAKESDGHAHGVESSVEQRPRCACRNRVKQRLIHLHAVGICDPDSGIREVDDLEDGFNETGGIKDDDEVAVTVLLRTLLKLPIPMTTTARWHKPGTVYWLGVRCF